MPSTGQKSLNLKFGLPLKEKQLAYIQTIGDGHDVMGVLPAGYGKKRSYTQFSLVRLICYPASVPFCIF